MKFAQRAKLIKNKAVINEESSGTIHLLKQEIRRLKKELAEIANSRVLFEQQMKSESKEDSLCHQCRSSIQNDSGNNMAMLSPRIMQKPNVGGVPDVDLNLGDDSLLVDDTNLEVSCLNLADQSSILSASMTSAGHAGGFSLTNSISNR